MAKAPKELKPELPADLLPEAYELISLTRTVAPITERIEVLKVELRAAPGTELVTPKGDKISISNRTEDRKGDVVYRLDVEKFMELEPETRALLENKGVITSAVAIIKGSEPRITVSLAKTSA